jgi:hypothetical protein
MYRALAFLALLFLSACATATPYQAAVKGQTAYGYSERRIEANRVALTFRGNSLTAREQVEDYLLYRAAELTLEGGFDYFVTAARATDPKRSFNSLGAGFRRGFFSDYAYFHPRFGWRATYDPFWDDVTIREVTRYEASAEIAMFKGEKPAGDALAFNAREVKANLAGKIVRPPAQS